MKIMRENIIVVVSAPTKERMPGITSITYMGNAHCTQGICFLSKKSARVVKSKQITVAAQRSIVTSVEAPPLS